MSSTLIVCGVWGTCTLSQSNTYTPWSLESLSFAAEAAFDDKLLSLLHCSGGTEYRCLGNLWWQDFMHSPTYGVPINKRSIADLRARYLANPEDPPLQLPMDVIVGVRDGEAENVQMSSLKNISPEEFSHSIIFACRDALKKGIDDASKRKWLNLMRNQMFVFRT